MFDEFVSAIKLHGRACKFIFSNGLAWTLLIPILVFALFGIFGFWSIGAIVKTVAETYGTEYSPLFLSIGIIVLRILFFVVFAIWGGYIVVIIMSPFLSYISEKTEHILNGKDYAFNLIQIVKDTFRGILLAIRNCFMEFLLGILFFLCAFVPVVGAAISIIGLPVILFLISAYYYGFSFMDYTNERRKMTVSQSVNYVKKRKGAACGYGFVFALVLCIPFIGSFLSAFLSIVATVASTIDMVENDKISETFAY